MVAESEFFAYLQNSEFGFCEELFGFEEDGFVDIVADCHSDFGFEFFGEGAFGDEGVGGDFFYAEFEGEVGADVVDCEEDAAGVGG